MREAGQNYRQVANWLTRERIPSQRNGRWAAQSVKNLVKRYERLTGKQLLVPYKAFPTPRPKKAQPEIPVVSWDDRGPGRIVRVRTKGFYWLCYQRGALAAADGSAPSDTLQASPGPRIYGYRLVTPYMGTSVMHR